MARRPTSNTRGIGKLAVKPAADDGLVSRTVAFIREQLPEWRDDPRRNPGSNEKKLNSSLCDFLDWKSRTLHPMVRFKHEELQTDVHSADIGVHATDEETWIGAAPYSIYEPFMVIEAKRLPAPTSDREREYVTGKKPVGGIQRFKLGLHGKGVATAAMVAYLEKETSAHWRTTINEWIVELCSGPSDDGCTWSKSEILRQFWSEDQRGIATAISTHPRSKGCLTLQICLHHLWVSMAPAVRVGDKPGQAKNRKN